MSGVDDPLSGVRDGHDRWARVYDHDANPLPALEEPHVREALGDVRRHDVLDLGCGTGRRTVWLADVSASVFGHRSRTHVSVVGQRRPDCNGTIWIGQYSRRGGRTTADEAPPGGGREWPSIR